MEKEEREKAEIKYGILPNVKMYFINRTSKVVGSFMTIHYERQPSENSELDIIIVKHEVPKKKKKDNIEYFFNEQEWINEIKNL